MPVALLTLRDLRPTETFDKKMLDEWQSAGYSFSNFNPAAKMHSENFLSLNLLNLLLGGES